MKRPTRPFVVEVKKKRGSPAKQRSIWGDLDLSALAAEPLVATKLTSEPVGNDPDPAVKVDRAHNAGSAIESPSEDRDAYAIADANHAEAQRAEVETEGAVEEPTRLPRKRVRRRRDEPILPRGQRWKRRLPKALRR